MRTARGISSTRRRTMGLAAGSIWLVGASAVFEIWALVAIGTPIARFVLVAAIVVMSAVIAFGVLVTRSAARLPAEPALREEQKLGSSFGWVVGAEILAFFVVNSWAVATGRFVLIPSLDLMIIGVHFVPLAWLFGVPRYHVLACCFCAIPAATLLLFPEASLLGQAHNWYVVPSLGCGMAATITAAASLREAWASIPREVAPAAR